MDNVFDYMELDDDHGIYEIPPLKEWVGCSIREADIARKHKVTVLGVRKEDDSAKIMPGADYVVRENEHLIVLASRETMGRLLKQHKG